MSRGGLLLRLEDGPLAGAMLEVDRCPRQVRCVRSTSGKIDILNHPDDEPAGDETVYWYEHNPDGDRGHICTRGAGCYHQASLTYAPLLSRTRPEGQLELATDG